MAFVKTNFQAVGGTPGAAPTFYTYTSVDLLATISASGYFNDLTDTLELGDSIRVHADTGGTPVVSDLWISANTGGVVDTTAV